MAEAAITAGAPRASRLDRRKARTHEALVNAAVRLIAEGRGERASIQEITEEADIGFGSFYNHFESKGQLFQAASEQVLERWGQMSDHASAGIADPAERLAVGLRLSGRLGWSHPDIARFLTGAGLGALGTPSGLAPLSAGRTGWPGDQPFQFPRCRHRPERRGRRPPRALGGAPAPPRTHRRDHRRPPQRGAAAVPRSPGARSGSPRGHVPTSQRHLVTADDAASSHPPDPWA